MGLATSLTSTAVELINNYGNIVVLEHSINDGVYNPQIGAMGTPVTQQFAIKAYLKPVTNEEMEMEESTWGRISSVATIVETETVTGIDNTWTLDGLAIKSVQRTTAQDTTILTKLYYG